jgi:hypothetical protein
MISTQKPKDLAVIARKEPCNSKGAANCSTQNLTRERTMNMYQVPLLNLFQGASPGLKMGSISSLLNLHYVYKMKLAKIIITPI